MCHLLPVVHKCDAKDLEYNVDKREQWEFLVWVWYYLIYISKKPLVVPESDPVYLVNKEVYLPHITNLFSKYLDNCISV